MKRCIRCGQNHIVKAGFKKLIKEKVQRYKCQDCKKFFTGVEKFTLIKKVNSRKADIVSQVLIDMLYPIKAITHTITSDNGKKSLLIMKKYQKH